MRRALVLAMSTMMVLGMLAGPALANNGKGPPDRDAPRGNSLISVSEPVELEPGDVEVQTSDPGADNFEEAFDYYVVRHGIDYDNAVYREPGRLGGDNFELAASSVGSYWFGVSGPDEDGVQSEIVHDGTVWVYFDTGDGWQHLKLEFADGELLSANGVSPE